MSKLTSNPKTLCFLSDTFHPSYLIYFFVVDSCLLLFDLQVLLVIHRKDIKVETIKLPLKQRRAR